MSRGGEEVRAQILKLCAREHKSVQELAESLGKSVHTVRAYYVYKMVAEGLLKPLHDSKRKNGQAYKRV